MKNMFMGAALALMVGTVVESADAKLVWLRPEVKDHEHGGRVCLLFSAQHAKTPGILKKAEVKDVDGTVKEVSYTKFMRGNCRESGLYQKHHKDAVPAFSGHGDDILHHQRLVP